MVALVAYGALALGCGEQVNVGEQAEAAPDGGSCGGLPYAAALCTTCAGASCCAAATACGADAGCAQAFRCVDACAGDGDCEAACAAAAGDSAPLLQSLRTCLADSCGTECA